MQLACLAFEVLGRVDEQLIGTLLSKKFHQFQICGMAQVAVKSHHRPSGSARGKSIQLLKCSSSWYRKSCGVRLEHGLRLGFLIVNCSVQTGISLILFFLGKNLFKRHPKFSGVVADVHHCLDHCITEALLVPSTGSGSIANAGAAAFNWQVVVVVRTNLVNVFGSCLVGPLQARWLLDVLHGPIVVRKHGSKLAHVTVGFPAWKCIQGLGLPGVGIARLFKGSITAFTPLLDVGLLAHCQVRRLLIVSLSFQCLDLCNGVDVEVLQARPLLARRCKPYELRTDLVQQLQELPPRPGLLKVPSVEKVKGHHLPAPFLEGACQ